MAAIARTLRPFLRCTRTQKRFYADAPAGDQMKFTFAGANQVIILFNDDKHNNSRVFLIFNNVHGFMQVFYDQAVVKQVDVPSFSGAFGILPKHVPTLAVLKPGVVTVYEQSGDTKRIFVSSGTVTINEDSSVQVKYGLSWE